MFSIRPICLDQQLTGERQREGEKERERERGEFAGQHRLADLINRALIEDINYWPDCGRARSHIAYKFLYIRSWAIAGH